jgi:hypothetical protein
MAIPNVASLYQKIHRGSEGGSEFARIMDELLISDSKTENYQFMSPSDRSGDYKGVDAIIMKGSENTGLQYKFYPSPLSPNHKTEIKSSFQIAVSKFPGMKKWILVIPEDPNKNDQEWFDSVKGEHFCDTEIWSHKHIINLMLKHKHVAEKYYPELHNMNQNIQHTNVNHNTNQNTNINNNVNNINVDVKIDPSEIADKTQTSKKGSIGIMKIVIGILIILTVAYVTYCVTNDKNNHRPMMVR